MDPRVVVFDCSAERCDNAAESGSTTTDLAWDNGQTINLAYRRILTSGMRKECLEQGAELVIEK